MNAFLAAFRVWIRQPTSLVCVGLVLGAGVYWLTRDGSLAALAASLPLGGINDNTAKLLGAIEAWEDRAPRAAAPSPAQPGPFDIPKIPKIPLAGKVT